MVNCEVSQEDIAFIVESNRIEGIHRKVSSEEVQEFARFMSLERVTIKDLEEFVRVYQTGSSLRVNKGMDVRIGNHLPIAGGPVVAILMGNILKEYPLPRKTSAFDAHVSYELVHPFTDCNGRSGRMLWMWHMRRAPLGFLHEFYYQALSSVQATL